MNLNLLLFCLDLDRNPNQRLLPTDMVLYWGLNMLYPSLLFLRVFFITYSLFICCTWHIAARCVLGWPHLQSMLQSMVQHITQRTV